MTHAMWLSLPGILLELDTDPAIRVIEITGAGDAAFISGADISQFEHLRNTVVRVAALQPVEHFAITVLP
jgi:enoyl-CoA hydratase